MGTKYDCLSKAKPDEPVFVLLGRDPVACAVIEFWSVLREKIVGGDEDQVREARECAIEMGRYAKSLGKGELVERSLELATELVK
jgi:hypothetical protein